MVCVGLIVVKFEGIKVSDKRRSSGFSSCFTDAQHNFLQSCGTFFKLPIPEPQTTDPVHHVERGLCWRSVSLGLLRIVSEHVV